jgi:hypothetical protein
MRGAQLFTSMGLIAKERKNIIRVQVYIQTSLLLFYTFSRVERAEHVEDKSECSVCFVGKVRYKLLLEQLVHMKEASHDYDFRPLLFATLSSTSPHLNDPFSPVCFV